MATIEIKVPMLPESVTDATVAKWYKKEGDSICRDENLVDLETDKVMLEVLAPKDGIIKKIQVKEGRVVKSSEILAIFEEDHGEGEVKKGKKEKKDKDEDEVKKSEEEEKTKKESEESESELSPAVRRLVAEKGLDVNEIEGSGKEGRITKKDVEDYLESQKAKPDEKKLKKKLEKGIRQKNVFLFLAFVNESRNA